MENAEFASQNKMARFFKSLLLLEENTKLSKLKIGCDGRITYLYIVKIANFIY